MEHSLHMSRPCSPASSKTTAIRNLSSKALQKPTCTIKITSSCFRKSIKLGQRPRSMKRGSRTLIQPSAPTLPNSLDPCLPLSPYQRPTSIRLWLQTTPVGVVTAPTSRRQRCHPRKRQRQRPFLGQILQKTRLMMSIKRP